MNNNNNTVHFTMYTDNTQYTSDSMACAGKRKHEVLMLDSKRQILQMRKMMKRQILRRSDKYYDEATNTKTKQQILR